MMARAAAVGARAADLIAAWLDGLGCTSPVSYVGASLGGLVGIAFAVRHAERCARLITISAGLRPDGWAPPRATLQRELVRDGLRTGDVATGMTRAPPARHADLPRPRRARYPVRRAGAGARATADR